MARRAIATRRESGWALVVLLLAGLSYSLLTAVVVPALPTFQRSLHTSATGSAWLLTSFLLSASVGTALTGRLGDLYGRQRMLLVTLLLLAAGTLLACLAESLSVLIVARIVQGIGGGIFPLSFSIMRDELPTDRVAGAIGLMSSILGIGAGAGLVIGALVVEHLGWHWLFWIPLLIMAPAALATWRLVPPSPIRSSGSVNWLAGVAMSLGLCLLLIGISQATVWGWEDYRTRGVVGAGVVMCAAWIGIEMRATRPLIDIALMRIRGVWTTNLAAFLLGVGMYATLILFPQFAQLPRSDGFGYGASAVVSSLYLLPSAFSMTLTGSMIGRITRRFGSRLAFLVGAGLTSAAFGFAAVRHDHPYDLVITMLLMGFGNGLAMGTLGNLVVQAVPSEQTAMASGMNTVMRMVGGALGGQLAATMIVAPDPRGTPVLSGFVDAEWTACGVLALCVLAGMLIPVATTTPPALEGFTP